MSVSGNTVRLAVIFRNFSGTLTDPTGTITLKFYDRKKAQIGSTINLTGANRDGVGQYHYDYTIPSNTTGTLTYEFAGVVSGYASVGRATIPVRFV
jgi:hypothetical protein